MTETFTPLSTPQAIALGRVAQAERSRGIGWEPYTSQVIVAIPTDPSGADAAIALDGSVTRVDGRPWAPLRATRHRPADGDHDADRWAAYCLRDGEEWIEARMADALLAGVGADRLHRRLACGPDRTTAAAGSELRWFDFGLDRHLVDAELLRNRAAHPIDFDAAMDNLHARLTAAIYGYLETAALPGAGDSLDPRAPLTLAEVRAAAGDVVAGLGDAVHEVPAPTVELISWEFVSDLAASPGAMFDIGLRVGAVATQRRDGAHTARGPVQ